VKFGFFYPFFYKNNKKIMLFFCVSLVFFVTLRHKTNLNKNINETKVADKPAAGNVLHAGYGKEKSGETGTVAQWRGDV